MADRSRDPEALERQIERARLELSQTIDELADRINPRNVAQRGAGRLKEEAGQVAKVVGAVFRPAEGEKDEESGGADPRLVAARAAAAVAVTALVIWRRRRRRR